MTFVRAIVSTLAMLAAASLGSPAVLAAAAPAEVAVPSPGAFASFLASVRPEAEARGVDGALFDATFAGMTPDPSVAAMTRRQPEFIKPMGAYLAAQVTPTRIAAGRALLERWRPVLDDVERRFGVPGAVVVAIWGLETNYGASPGNKDAIRSIATLAAMNYRPDLYRAELLAALALLKGGDAPREKLRGSWAGAMGQPQFMPSSFELYAVDGDGDGRRDIWASVPDALASIANFVRAKGWQPGQPWGFEVRLPRDLDIGDGRADFPAWAARGVLRADGRPLPESGQGILFFPAGAGGPAFLVTENFEVLKTYNFSDAYVIGVGTLADRMEGGAPVAAPWPTAVPMGRETRIVLQSRLVALGYEVDNREGRVSLKLRDVIRQAQRSVGMAPDGNPTDALLDALRSAPAKR